MMINILGISGSPVKAGNTESVLDAALSHIKDRQGIGTNTVALADRKFSGCNHCNWCVKNQSEGRFCVQKDDMEDIYPLILEADGIILATPVHFGRLSGLMANMIDRFRVFVHGNVYKDHLRNKVGGALAVAFFRGGGVETTLSTVNSMFHIFQMIVATSRLYQIGAGAFSSIDGKGRVTKGTRHMVLEDDFGTMSAKLLADRVVELARIVKAGVHAGEK